MHAAYSTYTVRKIKLPKQLQNPAVWTQPLRCAFNPDVVEHLGISYFKRVCTAILGLYVF